MGTLDVARPGMNTPWGKADYVNTIIDGIVSVATASHGGLKLSDERQAVVPSYMQRLAGWYEEDCEWAIPFVVFEKEIMESADESAKRAIREGEHKRAFSTWNPVAYERYFGVVLAPGESLIKDEREYLKFHSQDWIVKAAWGDWHGSVPKGMAGVCASVGCNRSPHAIERYFLVPAEEYRAASRFGFIVDPAKHKEIGKL